MQTEFFFRIYLQHYVLLSFVVVLYHIIVRAA